MLRKFIILLVFVCLISLNDLNGYAIDIPKNAKGGAILRAHTWSFKTIEENIPLIAAAGFNSIQVSPVQKTKATSPWWILYQPLNLHIGNYLGTYDQFKSMCTTAHRYGIKIMVDVVLNHVANNGTAGKWADDLDPSLKNPSYFHNNSTIVDYKDRRQVTQFNLLGLPDWNTQCLDVQKLHIKFLDELIDAGADGFRLDAAKHIETSGGEDLDWAGSYWDNIMAQLKQKGNLYCYGEVLSGGGNADNDKKYMSYFDITAYEYSFIIRNAVRNNDITYVENIPNDGHNINPNKVVACIENHDDYEHNQDNSASLSIWQRKMGYSIIAARAGITPYLLARSTDDIWKSLEIAIINKFHNAMVGKNEYLRYPRKDTLLVDRGYSGTAIINLGNKFYIDSPSNLPNGTYSGSGNTFNVSNGRITGEIKAKSVTAIYNGIVHGVSDDNSVS
jgi:alpha-amylase